MFVVHFLSDKKKPVKRNFFRFISVFNEAFFLHFTAALSHIEANNEYYNKVE